MFSFYFLLLQVSNPVPLAIQSTPQSASASEANAVSETKPSISDDKSLNITESVLTNQEPTVALGEFFPTALIWQKIAKLVFSVPKNWDFYNEVQWKIYTWFSAKKIRFSNFSCMFLNPNLNSNFSNLLDMRNLQRNKFKKHSVTKNSSDLSLFE